MRARCKNAKSVSAPEKIFGKRARTSGFVDSLLFDLRGLCERATPSYSRVKLVLPEWWRRLLIEAITQYLNGKSLDQAFGVKLRGAPSHRRSRKIEIAAAFLTLRESGPAEKKMKHYEDVAKKYHLSVDKVRQHVRDHSEEARLTLIYQAVFDADARAKSVSEGVGKP